MSSISLFETTKNISDQFDVSSDIILFEGDTNKLIETIPDNTVKLIITSPPYNIGKAYESKVSIHKYLEQQANTISSFSRILHDEGSICWQVGNYVEKGEIFPLDIYYYPIFKDLGFQLRNRIIWHFGHGLHTQKRFSGRYETLLWFTKREKYTFNLDPVRVPAKYPGKLHYKGKNKGKPSGNPKGKNPSDVWEIIATEWDEGFIEIPNVKSNHPEKTIHPCQFPIELVERCVLALTNESDWIFDPYAGVGSSIIAAIKRNRKAIGSEKESEFIDITKERIKSFCSNTLKTRPIGKPIHKPSGNEKVAKVPSEWKNSNQFKLLDEKGEYR